MWVSADTKQRSESREQVQPLQFLACLTDMATIACDKCGVAHAAAYRNLG